MWRNIASNFFTILIVLLVVGVAVIGWGQAQYTSAGPLEEPICLQVPRGGSMTGVSERLGEQGAVTSPSIFRIGANYSGRSSQLKAGSFLIEPGTSMDDIVSIVTGDGLSTCGTEIRYLVSVNSQRVRVRELDTSTQEFQVTAEFDPKADEPPAEYQAALDDAGTNVNVIIAEGVTSWQIVEALNASDMFTGEVAAIPDEGSLAPDGYEIRPGQDRQAFLDQLGAVQSDRLAAAWDARSEGIAVESPEDALILASIIEKETALAEERRLVASVFSNRLKRGIKLQTDPTVIYGVTEGRGVLGRGIRRSELRAENPWNTYVIDGLPATPIANPGLASIEAALNPDDSEYIFFVAKTLEPSDGHNFAVTLDEHNKNVAAYRALERAAE